MSSKEITLTQNYKHNFQRILVESLKLSGAKEVILIYGTNETLKQHLPVKDWDRGALYALRLKGILSFIAPYNWLSTRQQKYFPVPNHVMKKNRIMENQGISPFVLNRSAHFYQEGISAIMVQDINKSIFNTKEELIQVPVFCFRSPDISRFREDIQLNVQELRRLNRNNYLCFPIPRFGLLLLNNVRQDLFNRSQENELKDLLSILTKWVSIASTSYFNQMGKFISEQQRISDLQDMENSLKSKEKKLLEREAELKRKMTAMDKITVEKYRSELYRQRVPDEASMARQVIDEMSFEKESTLQGMYSRTMTHFIKRKKNISTLQKQWDSLNQNIEELKNIIYRATRKYRNLTQFPFWKMIIHRVNYLGRHKKEFSQGLTFEIDQIIGFMEYSLAAQAFLRGREYECEGPCYTSLMKLLKLLESLHQERLKRLGITFKYKNHTPVNNIRLKGIHHFHLQEDVFVKLIKFSIQGLQNKSNKAIQIDIYLKLNGKNQEYFEIHYRDNGRGIAYEDKESFFNDKANHDENNGSMDDMEKSTRWSMGPAIWKRVTSAGGSITEVGIPQEGAHFILCFDKLQSENEMVEKEPEYLKAQAKQSADSDHQLSVQGKRMLVIDDDIGVFLYISQVFDGAFHVSHANTSEEAWNQILGSDPPDIITLELDLKAAEKGEKLLLDLNSRGYGDKIPVIIVSGSDRVYEESRLMNLGAWGVVKKPIRAGELRDRVYQVLERQRQLVHS
ncbi:MAG: response regulator [Spirochaetales bacterium]|nr:response regulator [Spirochaetales bacterium]